MKGPEVIGKTCTAGTSQWQGDMLWSLKVRQWIQNHAWCYYYALIHEA
jgi:hypothetical protein